MISGNSSPLIPMIKKINGKILIILSSAVIILIVLLVYFSVQPSPSPYIYKVKTFRISGGWGYKIIRDSKEFIYQPFIPGVSGKKAFPDKRYAARAGKIVKEKLLNKEIPYFTREDLRKVGLDSLGNR